MQPNDSTSARKVQVTVRTYTPQRETSRRVQIVNTTTDYLEYRATSPHIESVERDANGNIACLVDSITRDGITKETHILVLDDADYSQAMAEAARKARRNKSALSGLDMFTDPAYNLRCAAHDAGIAAEPERLY